jgi:pyrimidine-nucleoside phosphorylase
MNNPLGTAVGNSLEVIEAIEALKGNGPRDLMAVTYALGIQMLRMAKIRGGIRILRQKIANGHALEKFKEVVDCQGGDPRVIDDYRLLPVAEKSVKVIASNAGYIHDLNTYAIGMSLVSLGGGRMKKEDGVDPSCGFKIYKKVGDHVGKGEPVAEIICSSARRVRSACTDFERYYSIKRSKSRHPTLIRETIS